MEQFMEQKEQLTENTKTTTLCFKTIFRRDISDKRQKRNKDIPG